LQEITECHVEQAANAAEFTMGCHTRHAGICEPPSSVAFAAARQRSRTSNRGLATFARPARFFPDARIAAHMPT
jgi:hypothetical protein